MIKYLKEGFCYPENENEKDMVYCEDCIEKCEERGKFKAVFLCSSPACYIEYLVSKERDGKGND